MLDHPFSPDFGLLSLFLYPALFGGTGLAVLSGYMLLVKYWEACTGKSVSKNVHLIAGPVILVVASCAVGTPLVYEHLIHLVPPGPTVPASAPNPPVNPFPPKPTPKGTGRHSTKTSPMGESSKVTVKVEPCPPMDVEPPASVCSVNAINYGTASQPEQKHQAAVRPKSTSRNPANEYLTIPWHSKLQ